jgi:hypothetical protein
MGHTCTDKQFMPHVLANLGDDYEYVQYHMDHRLSSSTNPLSIKELRAELNACYEKLKSKLNQKTVITTEIIFKMPVMVIKLYMQEESSKVPAISVVSLDNGVLTVNQRLGNQKMTLSQPPNHLQQHQHPVGQDHHQVKEEVQVIVNRLYVLIVNILAIVSHNVLISNVLKEHLQMLQVVQTQIFLKIHNLG